MKRDRFVSAFLLTFLVAAILIFVLAAFPPPVYTEAEVTAELAQIRAELPLAKAQWAVQDIASYDVTVTGGVPLACLLEVTLQVRDGNVVAFSERAMVGQPVTQPLPDESPCSYQTVLISEMFKRVEERLAQVDLAETYLIVEFDPVYGFVADYQTGCTDRQITDCGSHFTFSDFRPVVEGH